MTDKELIKSLLESKLIGGGWKVSVIIEGDKVQVVIDDKEIEDGITVIDMYHNDKYVRICTDHQIRENGQ